MPIKSPFPDVDVPNLHLWDFLFGADPVFSKDKPIYVDSVTDRSRSFKQVRTDAINFGHGLRTHWAWKPNDVLAIFSPNSIDLPAIIWGTHYAGGIVTPANPAYTANELTFQLKDSRAKALVTQSHLLKTAREACQQAGIPPERVVTIDDHYMEAQSKEESFKSAVRQWTAICTTVTDESEPTRLQNPAEDLAFIVYSSGTTGHPKGVMLSHRNIVANILMVATVELRQLSWKPRPHMPNGDAILAFLPFSHIYGLTVIVHLSFFAGLTCVVMSKFDIEGWCRTVQTHKITYGYIVPPLLLHLVKNPVVDNYDLSSLRMMNCGAAPLTSDLVHALHEKRGLKVKQAYGLSETSPGTHFQQWDEWQSAVGSVGKLLPNQSAKYMSPELTELPLGETGELWIKGPNVFLGYLNNPEQSRDALIDGYFRTGDVGFQDHEGNMYITDRVKELIKYKGFQVAPAELEGLLAAHPQVQDVAVVGLQRDDLATEVPLAFIVPANRQSPELERDIVNWLASKVANHKQLRGGVRFVDEIPKSPSGKILRRLLKLKLVEDLKQKKQPLTARL